MTARRNSGIASFVGDLKRSREARAEESGEARDVPRQESREVFAVLESAAIEQPRQPKKGPGRPVGKSSNPDYTQYSIKIRIATHDTAIENLRTRARRLGSSPNRIDFSDLVEELLAEWNSGQAQ